MIHQSPHICVTGIGLTAANAATPEQLWENAMRGLSPARVLNLPNFNANTPSTLAACTVEESLAATAHRVRLRAEHRLDRCARLALLAASRAWIDAGLHRAPSPAPEQVGVVAGSSRGPIGKWSESHLLLEKGKKIPPSLAANSAFASLHGTIASAFNICGVSFSVSTACASGGHAIALAANLIRSGALDIAIAGGCDAPLHPTVVLNFLSTGICDTSLPPERVCRPFDISAAGTLLGEGACFLVLESATSASRRGARIHGVLAGWGMAADGSGHSPEFGGARALRLAVASALDCAELAPAAIGYVNVHGTGTQLSDRIEIDWLCEFNASRKNPVFYGSTKPVTGHCLGATPALEAAICLSALDQCILPPSAHCFTPRTDAPAGLLLAPTTLPAGSAILSTSLSFWGTACALIFVKALTESSPRSCDRLLRISTPSA